MARTVVASVYYGLGGSFIAQALAASTYYKFWAMRVINSNQSISQTNDSLGSPPAGWSSGDSLTLFSSPAIYEASILPEGGSGVRLNGTSQYMASVYDETADLTDVGPQSLEVVLEIQALPGVGVEPAVMGGSTEFAVTLRSDGRVYGYYNGVAVCDLPITLNVKTHIVLTRSDGSPDSIKLYVNGVVDTATPANGTINRGFVHLGKHWTNAHYLSATYSFAGFYPVELTAVQVAAHNAASAWTDVSDDVEITDPIVIERGIKDDSPIARVAATGIGSWTMDNSERNSVGLLGYYTPGHLNCRTGFGKGIPCKVTMTAESTEYTQFVGRVRRIAPTADVYGVRRTQITATDWLDEAARFRLAGVPILENVRADEVFTEIVQRMPNQPHGLTLHACSETYDLALDNTRDEAVPALEEFVRLQESEVGRIWVSREGRAVCESRYTRPVDHADVLTDIGEKMLSLDAAETTDLIINRVEVTVHPRRVDPLPTTVLFSLERPITLQPGDTQVFTGTYVSVTPDGQAAERVGGLAVALSSYSATELEDGTGADRTASVAVAVRFDANAVKITLTNTNTTVGVTSGSAEVHVQTLVLMGRGIYDFQPIVSVAQADEAIASDGVNSVAFDMGYQENPVVGASIARALLAAYQGETLRARQVTVCANEDTLPVDVLARDISDRIALTESMTALDGEYHINGVRVEFSDAVKCDVSWWLVTAAEGDALMAWEDVPFSAGNFTAASGTWTVDAADQTLYRWTRQGPDTMVLAFRIQAGDVSAAAANLRIAIPGGFLAAQTVVVGHFRYSDAGGTAGIGFISATVGLGYLTLVKAADAAWTITSSDNTLVNGTTCPFEIQT